MKLVLGYILAFSNMALFAQTQALSHLVYKIRHPETRSEHFRQALETIGEYLALNVLEELEMQETTVQTLTGKEATHQLLNEMPVLITILR